jgi:putative aldouronate transport system substrate-binding protein
MKKLTVLFFCMAACAVFMTGCKPKTGTAAGAGTGGSGRLANGDVTMTLFLGYAYGANNTSYAYEDNWYTRKIADETGINLVVDSSSGADMAARKSTMLNTGDYPEVFYGTGFGITDLEFYAQQGIFIPLDSYDLSKYPNIKELIDLYPQILQSVTGSDGKIYALPGFNYCLHCDYDYGTVNYYMPFLRDNNLKRPETYDEFISYLRWVKANDANGNGDKNDEIPMIWNDVNHAVSFWARNYMPWVNGGIAVINGQVTLQFKQNEFRETLRLMRTLFAEGIYPEDIFTMTGDDRASLVNAETPVVAANTGRNNGANRGTPAGQRRWIEHNLLPPLTGQTGQAYAAWVPSFGSTGLIITDKCKDPELAIALYDYLLSFENQISTYYGQKGDGWDDPDPDMLSFLGTPALFKVNMDRPQLNTSWQGNFEKYTKEFRYGQQAPGITEVRQWLETANPSLLDTVMANPSYYEEFYYIFFEPHEEKALPVDMYLPPLAMIDLDSNRLADINATLTTYYNQAVMEFITGIKNINSNADWNAYLTQLDQLGAAEKAALYQKYLK